jgi:hypothetical protein
LIAVHPFIPNVAVMTIEELLASAANDSSPAGDLSPEVQTLWHTKSGNWEAAHNIAQDIHTAMGSWLHAMLHLIEGDVGNAGYWFRQAGQPGRSVSEIDALWTEIATELLS